MADNSSTQTVDGGQQSTQNNGSSDNTQATQQPTGGEQQQTQPPDDGAIRLTPRQLDERIERAVGTRLKDLEAHGRLLDEKEAQERLQAQEDARRQEEERLKKAGDYEKILSNQSLEFEKAIKEKDAQLQSFQTQVDNMSIDRALTNALTDPSVPKPNPNTSLEKIKRNILLEGNLAVKDGRVVVVKPDGTEMFGADHKPMGVTEYVTGWLADNPIFVAPAGHSGPGGGVSGLSGTVKLPPNATDDAVWATLTDDQKTAAIEAYGLTSDRPGTKLLIGKRRVDQTK